MEGDPVASEDQQSEQKKNEACADKTQFLTDDGEDEIVLRLGKKELFLAALAEAHAEETAGADGVKGLDDLVAAVLGVGPGVFPDQDALGLVALEHQQEEAPRRSTAHSEPPQLDAADKQYGRGRHQNQDRTGQVRFEVHQHRNGQKDDPVGDQLHKAPILPLLGDMAQAVNDHARANGFRVVVDIGGHGVGVEFHEDPWISYVARKGTEMLMVPGMMFTIEPMINMGTEEIYVDEKDEWTVYTADGKPSAQWEIQVLVTEDGHEVISW